MNPVYRRIDEVLVCFTHGPHGVYAIDCRDGEQVGYASAEPAPRRDAPRPGLPARMTGAPGDAGPSGAEGLQLVSVALGLVGVAV